MTGLYRVYDGADGLLYIGVSKHFGVRWQQHAQKQPWWNGRRRMTVDFYDDRDEAFDAEALAIFNEQPKYNVRHRNQALRLKALQAGQVEDTPSSGHSEARAAYLAAASALGLPHQGLTPSERVTVTRIVRLRTDYAALARIVESRKCWSCGAEPGELCRTRNGKLAYHHQARFDRLSAPAMSAHAMPTERDLVDM